MPGGMYLGFKSLGRTRKAKVFHITAEFESLQVRFLLKMMAFEASWWTSRRRPLEKTWKFVCQEFKHYGRVRHVCQELKQPKFKSMAADKTEDLVLVKWSST